MPFDHPTVANADCALPLPPARPNLLSRLVEGLGVRLRTARARRAVASELAGMADCELADMGIKPCDVERRFDPAIVPEVRSRGRLGEGGRPLYRAARPVRVTGCVAAPPPAMVQAAHRGGDTAREYSRAGSGRAGRQGL